MGGKIRKKIVNIFDDSLLIVIMLIKILASGKFDLKNLIVGVPNWVNTTGIYERKHANDRVLLNIS